MARSSPVVDDSQVITGHEAEIDELVQLLGSIAQAQKRVEEIRANLDQVADSHRCMIESWTGQACKTIHVKGTSVNGRYSFQERYSTIDLGQVPALRMMIGAEFEKLFARTDEIEIKRDAAPRLLELLRRDNRQDEFLTVDPCYRPVDEFRSVRAKLRLTLTPEANKAIDEAVKQIAYKPSFSVK